MLEETLSQYHFDYHICHMYCHRVFCQFTLTGPFTKGSVFLILGDEDLNAYKYNEEKTLSWLQRKTERVAEVLKQKGIHVSGGAVSATFVKSGKPETSDAGKASVVLKTKKTII